MPGPQGRVSVSARVPGASARVAGVQAMATPAAFDDPQEVALACAGYVSAGQVK